MADVQGQADEDYKPFNFGLQMHDGPELPAFGSSMMPDLNRQLEECYMNLGELVPTKYTFTAPETPNPTFFQFLPGPSFEPIQQAWEGEIAGASSIFPDPNSSFVVPVMKIEGVDPAYNPHQQQLLDQQQCREARKIKNHVAAARSQACRIASNMGRMEEPSENTSSENSKIARSNSF